MKRTGNSKIAVVGWGRGMGHKGHMYLADAVIVTAQSMKADPYFFVSKTVGKDDPLMPDEKIKIYQSVFPQQATIFTPQGNLNQALEQLAQLKYDGVVLVVGADQKEAFKYLERPNKEGVPVYQSFGLKKLKVISRQETRSQYAREEGPRATPMREILMHPNASEEQKYQVWRRDMPEQLSDQEVLDLMHKAEQRLMTSNQSKRKKVKEFIERAKPMMANMTVEQKQKIVSLLESVMDEGRIFHADSKVDLFYVTKKGDRQILFKSIPQRMLDKAIMVLRTKYPQIKDTDIEMRPTSQPSKLDEFAPDDSGDSGQEDMFFKYAKLWYNGNLEVQNRIQEILDKAGWEIGEIESEEGGAFIVQSGDEDGKSYMGWSAEELGQLNEFAPDEGGGSRKFIPWAEFIEQLKQILHKDFDCKENVVKSTIKARFVPHDPMEYGPTMLYSYYETRAGGRNKGAVSTRGSIQVGKYFTGGLFGQEEKRLLTSFNLLKGHPFERHFDLTFENLYKIANIIQGNTEGALEFQPQVAETALNKKNPKDDLDAKRKVLQQMEREPGHDKDAIRQRKLDLEKEARQSGLSEDYLDE